MGKIILYHGSNEKIEKPLLGKGKVYNDYGQGFYCTEHIELAKEWSCTEGVDGFAGLIKEKEIACFGMLSLCLLLFIGVGYYIYTEKPVIDTGAIIERMEQEVERFIDFTNSD